MEMVKLYSIADYHQLPETKWKIKQPALDDERENALLTGGLDMIICPGVAFTPEGHRLGHGKGYYDSFLRNLTDNSKKPIHIFGLALKEQIYETIPFTERDFQLQKVLFDNI